MCNCFRISFNAGIAPSKQRVNIALELVADPTILVLDEPTTGANCSFMCMKSLPVVTAPIESRAWQHSLSIACWGHEGNLQNGCHRHYWWACLWKETAMLLILLDFCWKSLLIAHSWKIIWLVVAHARVDHICCYSDPSAAIWSIFPVRRRVAARSRRPHGLYRPDNKSCAVLWEYRVRFHDNNLI